MSNLTSPKRYLTLSDRTLGIIALLFAAFFTWFGYDLEAPFSYEPVGPRAFPLLLALIMAICGLVLLLRGGHTVEPNPAGANSRIFLMIVFIAAYALFFEILGFIIATALMAIFVGRLFGGSWIKTIINGVIMGVVCFLLFDRIMDVALPTGILGGLL